MDYFLNKLSMGGYGFFVWTSYLATFIIMLIFFINSTRKMKLSIKLVHRYLRRTG